MTRLTRQQAAIRLQVSESTIDRMIKRGQLATEKESHGGRYTVWVLVDDNTAYSDADDVAYAGQSVVDKSAYASEHADYANEDGLTALKTENRTLRELADYHRKLLDESEWRYRELMEQLRETTAALSRALPAAPEATPVRRRRWWFW